MVAAKFSDETLVALVLTLLFMHEFFLPSPPPQPPNSSWGSSPNIFDITITLHHPTLFFFGFVLKLKRNKKSMKNMQI